MSRFVCARRVIGRWTSTLLRRAMRPNTRVVVINFHTIRPAHTCAPADFARLIDIAELARCASLLGRSVPLLEHSSERLPTAAERSSSAVSLGVMSAVRACRHPHWVDRDARPCPARPRCVAHDYTTICNAGPSEILALIALRARTRVLERSTAIVRSNLAVPR